MTTKLFAEAIELMALEELDSWVDPVEFLTDLRVAGLDRLMWKMFTQKSPLYKRLLNIGERYNERPN